MTIALTNRNRIVALVALVLAAGIGLVIFNWLVSVNRTAAALPPRRVIVARQAIPARATIVAAMLRFADKPADAVDSDAVLDPHLALGSIALISIPADSTITASKLGRANDAGITVRLKRGLRAIAIAVDKVKDVAGMVHPGDYVDVVAVQQQQGSFPARATTIMRRILVLAVGSNLETPSTGTPAPDSSALTTVTLAVTPHQADQIALADTSAILRLTLRPPDEPARSEAVGTLSYATVAPPPVEHPAPALAAAPPAPAAAAPAPARPQPAANAPARPPATMWIIEGDRITAPGSHGAR